MNQYSRTNLYVKRLQKSRLLTGTISKSRETVLAGAESKEDGINLPEDMEREIISSVTEYVLAPALNGFVTWVLAQAMARGIRRLYFLARDGYFMYRTACRYVEEFSLPIECRYLYCSRYSVRIPGYHLDTEKALDYITLGGLDVTVRKLFERAGFDEAQMEQLYEAKILPYEKEEQIPRKKLAEMKEILSENSLFMKFLIENSRKAWPAYEKYLRQEGLLEEITIALVDSGWVGSMQKELNQSLQRFGRKEPLSGFYWGLYELPDGVNKNQYYTYFFSPEGEMKRKVMFNNCLFETIFTAPHGMTLCYSQEKERVIPVLSDFSAKRAKRLAFVEELFLTWQEAFLRQREGRTFKQLAGLFNEKQTCRAIEKNMELFMHHPTREEARTFGKMDFTDDILEGRGSRIATRLSEQELKENHLLSRLLGELTSGKKHIRQSAWYEGSAAAYGKHPEYHIFQYTGYKYLLYYRKWEQQRRQEYGK